MMMEKLCLIYGILITYLLGQDQNYLEYLKTPIFELYDVKGSKILSNPFKLTEPIDVSDLQPSMYIYNVKDGSEVKQSGKVLIE